MIVQGIFGEEIPVTTAVFNFFIIQVKNFNQLKVVFFFGGRGGGESIKNESLCCLFFTAALRGHVKKIIYLVPTT